MTATSRVRGDDGGGRGGPRRLRRVRARPAAGVRPLRVPPHRRRARGGGPRAERVRKVYRRWDAIQGFPDAYVRRTIVNEHASWWRRTWRHREVVDSRLVEVLDPVAAQVASRDAEVWARVVGLPRQQRAVVVLRHVRGPHRGPDRRGAGLHGGHGEEPRVSGARCAPRDAAGGGAMSADEQVLREALRARAEGVDTVDDFVLPSVGLARRRARRAPGHGGDGRRARRGRHLRRDLGCDIEHADARTGSGDRDERTTRADPDADSDGVHALAERDPHLHPVVDEHGLRRHRALGHGRHHPPGVRNHRHGGGAPSHGVRAARLGRRSRRDGRRLPGRRPLADRRRRRRRPRRPRPPDARCRRAATAASCPGRMLWTGR